MRVLVVYAHPLADSFAAALHHARFVLDGLQIDPARMRANLDATKGLIVSEAVMMGLGPALGRQRAHDLDGERDGVSRHPAVARRHP